MAGEVAFNSKRLGAEVAIVRTFSAVHPHVCGEAALPCKCLAAGVASVNHGGESTAGQLLARVTRPAFASKGNTTPGVQCSNWMRRSRFWLTVLSVHNASQRAAFCVPVHLIPGPATNPVGCPQVQQQTAFGFLCCHLELSETAQH